MTQITIDTLKCMKQGETITDEGITVKRTRRTVYVLFLATERGHARWGTAAEIAADIEHTRMHGCLPREKTC